MDNDISVDNEDVVKVDSIFKEVPEEKDIYYLEPQELVQLRLQLSLQKMVLHIQIQWK